MARNKARGGLLWTGQWNFKFCRRKEISLPAGRQSASLEVLCSLHFGSHPTIRLYRIWDSHSGDYSILWGITPCIPLKLNRRFGGASQTIEPFNHDIVLNSIPGYFMWILWWSKWHLECFSPRDFGFILLILILPLLFIHLPSSLRYVLGLTTQHIGGIQDKEISFSVSKFTTIAVPATSLAPKRKGVLRIQRWEIHFMMTNISESVMLHRVVNSVIKYYSV
jgi:hypothetical protein